MTVHYTSQESTTKQETIIPLLVSLLQRDVIKSLTLTEPWAELIAIGAKKLETRSWPTEYRGPLAIHSSLKFPVQAEELCDEEPFYTTLTENGFQKHLLSGRKTRNAWKFPTGHVVAVVWLEDVYRLPPVIFHEQLPLEPELSFGNFAPGRFVWSLPMMYRPLAPIKATGAYGLWDWQPPVSFWDEVQSRLDDERRKERRQDA